MDIGKLLETATEQEESRSVELRRYLNGIREKEQSIIKAFQDKQRKTIEKEQAAERELQERIINDYLESEKKRLLEEEERKRSLVNMDAETERKHRVLLRNLLNNRSGFKE